MRVRESARPIWCQGHVLQPLPHPLVHPVREHPAARARGLGSRRGHEHPTTAVGTVDSLQHAVSGQVQEHARSVTLRARSLDHGSWSFCRWMCQQYPSQRRATSPSPPAHHAEVRRAG